MIGLIKNELLKLSRKSKLYIVIGFLVLASVIQCYSIHSKIIAKSPEKIIEECDRLIESMQNMTVIQSGGSEEDISTNVDQWIADTIENAKKEKEYAQKQLENMGRDWKINVREEIKLREEQKAEAIAEGNIDKEESIDTRIKILNYHLDHDIKPEKEYVMNNTVILDVITYIGSIFLAVIVMILTVETIAVENSPGTLKLLLTKPVQRGKIYLSKFIVSLITSLGIVLAVELLTYLVIGIIFGFGNLQAPTPVGPKYVSDPVQIARYGMGVKPLLGSTVLIPLWQKLAILLLTQTIFIITVVSLGMFISAIMKNGVSAIILGLLITALFTVMTIQINDFGSMKVVCRILPFLFSAYSAGSYLLSGHLSNSLNSTIISLSFAMFIMIAWATLFFLVGYRHFVKKDVLA